MGTNYYLSMKTDFNPLHRLPACLGCHEGEDEPLELKNGWLWNNTYYVDVDTMNREYFQKIHIGKSSGGWRFFLCQYPTENPRFKGEGYAWSQWLDKPIETLEDWIELFNDKNNIIVDEYGNKISPQEMLKIICEREPIRNHPDGWETDGGSWYRYVNGLCVHDETKCPYGRPNLITIMPDNVTYDMVLSGNDVESGIIFS